MAFVLPGKSVLISTTEAKQKYGVCKSHFNSLRGYFLLKKETFEKITSTVEAKAKVRDAVMAKIEVVMGLDGKGKASGPVAERFCKMNGLDIKKAEFFMESSVPNVEIEIFVFFARQEGKIKDIVYLSTNMGAYGDPFKMLRFSEDNGGKALCVRYGKDGREDKIEDILKEISSKLTKGFVAVHDIYRHKPDSDGYHVKKTIYP